MRWATIVLTLLCSGCSQPYTLGAIHIAPGGVKRLEGQMAVRFIADKRDCIGAAREATEGVPDLIHIKQHARVVFTDCMGNRGYTVTPGMD